MTDAVSHSEVHTTRRSVAPHGRTEVDARYDYAPVTNPLVGQNTFLCKADGMLVYDRAAHDDFHDLLDKVVAWSAPLTPPIDKITEPLTADQEAFASEVVAASRADGATLPRPRRTSGRKETESNE